MAHPVHAAADVVATEYPYPADVVAAAVELYEANLEILDRRPLFGHVAESYALGMLAVVDYLGPDTVRYALMMHRSTPVDRLTRERFGR